ncbi:hypothetical protein C8N47_11337 [Mangrovibacterium marinum]|uniref:Uncharacterized protein n=1 Tax=Mangrovibacterium marinum TaxID=1639118 RepID=A0A2T5BZQ4_9BACT|nr:hypothetical protein C8N47_11337 [Mangrovibacterium marinum]
MANTSSNSPWSNTDGNYPLTTGQGKHGWKKLPERSVEPSTDGNCFPNGRWRQARMEIASRTVGGGKHGWKLLPGTSVEASTDGNAFLKLKPNFQMSMLQLSVFVKMRLPFYPIPPNLPI